MPDALPEYPTFATLTAGYETRNVVAEIMRGVIELARQADAPSIENRLLADQVAQHQRWKARAELGAEIVRLIAPHPDVTANGVNAYGYESLHAEPMEEPKPAQWQQALELIAKATTDAQDAVRNLDRIDKASRTAQANLAAALGNSTPDGGSLLELALDLHRFVNRLRSAVVAPGVDVDPSLPLDGLLERVSAGTYATEVLRLVPPAVREAAERRLNPPADEADETAVLASAPNVG